MAADSDLLSDFRACPRTKQIKTALRDNTRIGLTRSVLASHSACWRPQSDHALSQEIAYRSPSAQRPPAQSPPDRQKQLSSAARIVHVEQTLATRSIPLVAIGSIKTVCEQRTPPRDSAVEVASAAQTPSMLRRADAQDARPVRTRAMDAVARRDSGLNGWSGCALAAERIGDAGSDAVHQLLGGTVRDRIALLRAVQTLREIVIELSDPDG